MSYSGVVRAARLAGAAVLAAALLVAGPALASTRDRHSHNPNNNNNGSGGIPLTGLPFPPTFDGIPVNGKSQHLGERVLRPGMSGHDVRVLQEYLTIVGFPAQIDGTIGAQTEQAIKDFQAAHNLSVTGVMTIREDRLLRSLIAAIDAIPAVGKARINADGTATAPVGAPQIVVEVIAAANRIIDKPYVYGGGHGRWNDVGYDCSGSVSYALHGAGLLTAPEDSTELESYGSPGPGHWLTIYADSGHTWIVVAGIAFDTADYGGPNIPGGTGPRWRSNPTGNLADGGDYVVRHPGGL